MLLYCNGQLLDAGTPLFDAANRGFRYGDGLFETIKILKGVPLLWQLHMHRLHYGMSTLGIQYGADLSDHLLRQVVQLCQHNNCTERARVRIAVYRHVNDEAGFVVEAGPLASDAFAWNEQGWRLGTYGAVQKSIDLLANHKTANYLLYTMAARAAQQQQVDECLVLNTKGNICDGSRTNIFLIKQGQLITPALTEGCVAGVMRSYLLQYCRGQGIEVLEKSVDIMELTAADEVCLTNAIQGLRWVHSYGAKTYGNTLSRSLYAGALATIYR